MKAWVRIYSHVFDTKMLIYGSCSQCLSSLRVQEERPGRVPRLQERRAAPRVSSRSRRRSLLVRSAFLVSLFWPSPWPRFLLGYEFAQNNGTKQKVSPWMFLVGKCLVEVGCIVRHLLRRCKRSSSTLERTDLSMALPEKSGDSLVRTGQRMHDAERLPRQRAKARRSPLALRAWLPKLTPPTSRRGRGEARRRKEAAGETSQAAGHPGQPGNRYTHFAPRDLHPAAPGP